MRNTAGTIRISAILQAWRPNGGKRRMIHPKPSNAPCLVDISIIRGLQFANSQISTINPWKTVDTDGAQWFFLQLQEWYWLGTYPTAKKSGACNPAGIDRVTYVVAFVQQLCSVCVVILGYMAFSTGLENLDPICDILVHVTIINDLFKITLCHMWVCESKKYVRKI